MLRLNLGDLVEWEDNEYTVAASSGAATLLYRLADGQRVWVDLATLAGAGDVSLRPKMQQATPSGIDAMAASLTEEESADALWWEAHISEILYGVPSPHDETLTPRCGYDDPSKVKRRKVKVQELRGAGMQVSVRTLARKEALYRERGLRGLLDQRTNNGRPPEVDSRVIEAVLAVLEDTASKSTVTTVTLINRVRAYVTTRNHDGDVSLPSKSTLRRLIEAYDTRGLARGKATTRRSAGNRPDRGPAPIAATAPGQVVEIDSTPVNVLCLMPDGKVGRPVLTVPLDVATRSILAFLAKKPGNGQVEPPADLRLRDDVRSTILSRSSVAAHRKAPRPGG